MSASPGEPPESGARRGAAVALVLVYPLVVYGGLRFLDARALGALLGGLLVVRLVVGLRSEAAEHWRAISLQLLPAGAVIALTLLLNEGRYLLALPVLISASLFWVFARSLWGPLTIVERVARIQDPDLTPEEARYCTSVTRVWCGFFLVNGGIAGFLAIGGSLEWWTLYTGLISYGLMGSLFAIEFSIRKIRFRRFGPGVFDRIALALIGPGEGPDRTTPPDPGSRLG